MAAVDVVGAVGGEQDDPAELEGAEEIAEQLAGGAVGPVQILHDQHQGAVGGEGLQQAGGQLEEAGAAVLVAGAVLGGAGLAQLGQQPGQLAAAGAAGGGRELLAELAVQRAEQGGDGGEGQAVRPDLHAGAERDQGPGRLGLVAVLLHQAALADPRLAAEQQRLRLAGRGTLQRLGEPGALPLTADEDGADGAALHVTKDRTGV